MARCWRDNVFIERFWRSLKYEEVYLNAYESASQARTSIGKYIKFYTSTRPHAALQGRTLTRSTFPQQPPARRLHNCRGSLKERRFSVQKNGAISRAIAQAAES